MFLAICLNCFAVVWCACSALQELSRSRRRVVGVAAALWLLAARVAADGGYTALGWTRQTGTTTTDVGYGVAVSGDGFIYVTGYAGGALNGQMYAGGYMSHTYSQHKITCVLFRQL